MDKITFTKFIIDPKIFLDYFAKEIGDGVELSPLITIKVS